MRSLIALPLIVLSLTAAASITDTRLPAPSPAPQAAIQVVNSVEKPRYRLSLIPGGAGNMLELDLQVQLDPVLQKFYKKFDFSKQREFVIDKDIEVYMSFRVGNQIRWTKKKVHVKAGEKAVTDGQYTILLRCGNMIAWGPQNSTEYPSEPLPPDLLETPMPPVVQDFPPTDLVMTGFDTPPVFDTPTIGPIPTGSVTSVTGFPGPILGFPPIIGTPIVPISPAPTPESSSLILVTIGVTILFIKRGTQ